MARVSRGRLVVITCSLVLHDVTAFCASARPPAEELVNRLNPTNLAYLGDAVFELEARERLLWPPAKVDALSSQVQALVCAEGQHAVLQRINADFGLTEDEADWLRRGRNASGRGPRRLDPKVYRAASALETLVGYLYTCDPERLRSLFAFIFDESDVVASLLRSSDEPPPQPA